MASVKSPITLTPNAAQRVRYLLDRHAGPAVGIRIGVKGKGCSGLSYSVEYAETKTALDEVVEAFGVTVLVDSRAMVFLFGSEMDYVEGEMSSGFVFRNPNEKARCGCGESFMV